MSEITHKVSSENAHGLLCGQFTRRIKSTTENDEAVTCKKCLWLIREREFRGQNAPAQDGIQITEEATGEVQSDKPYRTEEHLGFGAELVAQQRYVRQKLRDPDDPNAFARLSPDQIMEVLDHLSAYYDRLGAWIANQTLWHSDLKTAKDLATDRKYLEFKRKKGETNETARAEARLATHSLAVGIDKCRHQLNVVVAWKKSIGRYHDAARSSLSWEKQSQYMQRRNDNTPDRRN